MDQNIQGFRLSPQQRRTWSLSQAGGAYGIRFELSLADAVGERRLRAGLERLVDRNDILRTTYSRLAGMVMPIQIVRDEAAPLWSEVDLSSYGAAEARRRLGALFAEQGERGFDLESGPLVRAVLVRMPEGPRRLLVALPALCADQRAVDNIVTELNSACADGGDEPAEVLSYLQFSEFQNALLTGDQGADSREIWQRRDLASVPPLKLPFATVPEQATTAFLPRACSRSVEPRLAVAIAGIAGDEYPQHVLLLAAWQSLLWRLSGQDEVLVAYLADGRSYDVFLDAVGIFARWLPVNGRFAAGRPISESLAMLAEDLEEAEEAGDGFLWGGVDEEATAPQLPAVGFVFEESTEESSGDLLRLTRKEVSFERCDLTLECRKQGDSWTTRLLYDPECYRSEDVARTLDHFHHLLAAIAEDPRRPLDEQSILAPEERRSLLERNRTSRSFVDRQGFHRWFEEQVGRTPSSPAVVYEGESLSYAELNERANRLARHLRSLGVGSECPVVLCLERSLELIVGLLAVLKAGGAYVCLIPSQPKKRLAYMLEDLDASVVLTQDHRRGELSEMTAARVLAIDTEWPEIAGHSGDDLDVGTAPTQLAYIVFTSGSTGRPKGVMVEHGQLLNYVHSMLLRLDFPAGASYATVSTFAADLGNTMIFPALCTGGCLHVVSEERAADATGLAQYFAQHEIDCLKIVPSHLEALREVVETRQLVPRQRLILGGEALRPAMAQELREATPECVVFNHYGPSETTVGVMTHRLGEQALDPRCRTVPVGRPIDNVRAYLVDDHQEPVPAFITGELYIGGANVARGYLRRPALTAERFVPDPFNAESGARLYRTGDQAFALPSGDVVFLGRGDNQVKFHGFRVELDELCASLNSHPKVRGSVVSVRQDRFGHDVLVAYYVSRREIDIAELRRLLMEVILEETLPNLFVHLKKLPLTLNGKINYQALPGVEEAQRAKRDYVPARTPAEELMVQIWTDVLGLGEGASQRLGVEDNFFDLGGHSLVATQLVSRVRQTFELELPLRLLFESANLARFTAEVESRLAAAGNLPTIGPAPRDGELPLSFAQERLWVMDQLDPGNSAYNIHGPFRLRGRLDRLALERSVRCSVARHESLRTGFASIDGRAVQRIAEPYPLILPLVDLGALSEARREAEADRLVAEDSRRPFDLTRAPLLRILVFRLAATEHIVSVSLHHIVADGWSLGILMREIAASYASFSKEQEPRALKELPLQYADFAIWQRQWLQGDNLEAQLSYWQRRLRGAPKLLELPTDRPRSENASFRGGNYHFKLPLELSESLRQLSREQRVTLFMTLLATFKLLLSRYSGQEDIVVGTDVANRNRLETESLIGFFVNNLVLRTGLEGDPTFVELLERVRETTLGAYANQDMPFERLVKDLQPTREYGQAPLFQVLFVLQNTRPAEFSLSGLELEPLSSSEITAKFDLAFFVQEREGQVLGRWNYRPDLFDEATIARMAQHYEKLLAGVCAEPGAHLSSFEMFSQSERRRQTVIKKQRRSKKIGKLRQIRRRNVDLEEIDVVKTSYLGAEGVLPLVIEPNLAEVDLADWAASNREFIESSLLTNGALLFRGFGCDSAAGFESFARAATRQLYGDYGDLPREEGGEKIYHSTPYPADKMILFHNESSHLSEWPTRQLFYSATVARSGGETPIVDCRQAYRELDPAIVEHFENRKVMYIRNFTDGLDVSWQHFFKTEDKAVVESKCKEWSMQLEWKPDGLRTSQVCEAVVRHPQTAEKVFFNQLQLFHVACMDPEMRSAMLEVFDGRDLPRDFRYGDGSPVEDAVVEAVSETYRRLAVEFPWQKNDILMVDNMLVAHARNPFVGPRKIVVAMGDMMSRHELAT